MPMRLFTANPRNMNAIWLIVEYAIMRFMSVSISAAPADTIALAAATQSTAVWSDPLIANVAMNSRANT